MNSPLGEVRRGDAIRCVAPSPPGGKAFAVRILEFEKLNKAHQTGAEVVRDLVLALNGN